MASIAETTLLFRERQPMRSNWIAVVGGGAALFSGGLLAWIAACQLGLGQAVGTRPTSDAMLLVVALLLVPICLGLGWICFVGRMDTEVRSDGLYVQMCPLTRRHHFRFEEIESAAARRYSPIGEYGGWGIRFGAGGKAYNVRGNRGVQLVLRSGARLLIGSQRADELEAVLRSVGRVGAP